MVRGPQQHIISTSSCSDNITVETIECGFADPNNKSCSATIGGIGYYSEEEEEEEEDPQAHDDDFLSFADFALIRGPYTLTMPSSSSSLWPLPISKRVLAQPAEAENVSFL